VRYRRLLKTYGDWGLTLALAVGFLVETWVNSRQPGALDISGTDRALLVLGGVALALSIRWRRTMPLIVLTVAIANLILNFVVARGVHDSMASAIAMLVGVYSAAVYTFGSTTYLALIGTVALVPLVESQDPRPEWSLSDILFLSMVIVGPWIAGKAVRRHRERELQLQDLTIELDRQLEEKQSTAVAEERARIARELHDVVAHAITVMILQARGGRKSLATAPNEAVEAFDAIETTASQALTEMRRMLGLLQRDAQAADLAPYPSLGHLPDLIRQVDEAGLTVDLVVEGDPVPLSPGIDLSVYRIVQEALTNSLKHAGTTTARVVIRYEGNSLALDVTDTGIGPNGRPVEGRGLIGMRERVALYGGDIYVGPGEEDGFAVRVYLPVAADSR
jgi:signal transduction histidine kinase